MNFGEKREVAPAVAPEPSVERVEGRENEPVPESVSAAGERLEAAAAVAANARPVVLSSPVPAAPLPKDIHHLRIERVLEDDLVDVYLSLPPAVRASFKAEGEATALKLRAMFEQAKVRAKDVLRLVLHWLKLIPGVSRYFLEQEAKIKTDKIMLLAAERREEKERQV